MELGEMGFKSPKLGAPKLGGRGFANPSPSASPVSSRPMGKAPGVGRDLGTSSISSGMSAPPVKNLGSKIISALRARRRGMGAPRAGRRL